MNTDQSDIKERIALGWLVFGWISLSVALVSAAFFAIAFLEAGHWWQLPDKPGWPADVTRTAVPVAAIIGAAAAISVNIRRQQITEASHQLALKQEQRARGLDDDSRERDQQQRELALEQIERERVRGQRDRFTTAAQQLGHDQAVIRIAGVYALAALADDWAQSDNRREAQVCINLLCAYQRTPRKEPLDPNATDGPTPTQVAETEVRTTITAVIAQRLKPDDNFTILWAGFNFDFTGANFDAGIHNFVETRFSGGTVDFSYATFGDSIVDFSYATFVGGTVRFSSARFGGGLVDFAYATFDGGTVHFSGARFGGGAVHFCHTRFGGGAVHFSGARFDGGTVDFCHATFGGGLVYFVDARFVGGAVHFRGVKFSGGMVFFDTAEFGGGTVDFIDAKFGRVRVSGPWGEGPPPERWPPLVDGD